MIVGLDLHGVIDSDPAYFIEFARDIIEDGGTVHVITGHPINSEIYEQLSACGFAKDLYSSVQSIQDTLDEVKSPVLGLDVHGRNKYDDISWDSCKASLCKKLDVDVHIDDTMRYKDYFKETTFGHFDGEKIQYFA